MGMSLLSKMVWTISKIILISRVQGESLDSVPDVWRLLCHTYGRWGGGACCSSTPTTPAMPSYPKLPHWQKPPRVEILLERDLRERAPPAYGSLFRQWWYSTNPSASIHFGNSINTNTASVLLGKQNWQLGLWLERRHSLWSDPLMKTMHLICKLYIIVEEYIFTYK